MKKRERGRAKHAHSLVQFSLSLLPLASKHREGKEGDRSLKYG